MLPLHRNPLIYREWRIAFRPAKLWATLIVVFGLLALALVYLVLYERYRGSAFWIGPVWELGVEIQWARVFRQFAAILYGVQFFIAFYVCLGLTLDSLVKERQNNTHEFLVTLPLSPLDKLVGLCLGANLMPLLLLALMAPLGLAFGWAGDLSWGTLLWLHAILLCGFLASSTLGLAASSAFGKRRGAWIMVLLLLLLGGPVSGLIAVPEFTPVPVMALAPFGILAAALMEPESIAAVFQSGQYHFYAATAPWQLCPAAFYLFLAAVSFATATRRLSRPSCPPMPRWATAIGFAVFQFLLVGFLADAFRDVPGDYAIVAGVYLTSFFLVILVWNIFSTPSYAALMQWVERRPHWSGRVFGESFTDLRAPPFVAAAVLWAITVVSVLCINAAYWEALPAARIVLAGAIMLLFLLAYGAACLLASQLARRGGGPLALLFYALATLIPLSFASIKGLEDLIHATPFGLFGSNNLFTDYYPVAGLSMTAPVVQSILWGLGLLVFFSALCVWRFQVLLRISPLGRRLAAESPQG